MLCFTVISITDSPQWNGNMKRLMLAVSAVSLLALLAVSLFAVFAQPSFTYPVRVTFHFIYRGRPFETSYLTIVRKGLGNPEISWVRYAHSRDRTSFKLPDGSLVLLRPEWPWESQGFDLGKKYMLAARWFWQDSVHQPKQIVYGDSATKHLAPRSVPAPFTWLDVTATIERLDQTYLSEALQADTVHDDDDKIEFSSMLGGAWNFQGTLFTSLVIVPLGGVDLTEIKQLKGSPGWIAASNHCRFRPMQPADAGKLLRLTNWTDRIGMLRDETGWSPDGGPHPGEPSVLYSTERKVTAQTNSNGFSALPSRSFAIDMVQAVKWSGTVCSGIEPPDGSQNLLLQFGDGTLALIVPSDILAVLSD